MFIGHFAMGFAGKAAAPKINLGWLMTAGVFVDLVFTVFLLVGVEHARIVPGFTQANPFDLYDFPWSHSLAANIGWSLLVALGWWSWRKNVREAMIIGLVVMSHWVLDLMSHIPDLAMWPGSETRLGFGLWQSIEATIIVEGGLWIAGLALYLRATKPKDRVGRWSFLAFAVVLSLIYGSGFMSPPPPDIPAMAWTNLCLVLFLIWPAWYDRHRARRRNEKHY